MLAQNDSRTFFELAPLLPMSEWWHSALLLVMVAVVLCLSVAIYRRDTYALPKSIAVALLTLRIMALLGLLVFFLGPEKRSESRIIKPSRLAVLIDTSLSMGLTDAETNGSKRRVDTVIDVLRNSDLLTELNEQHELTIYRFGDGNQPEPIITSPKQSPVSLQNETESTDEEIDSLQVSRGFGVVGQIGLALSAILLLATVLLKLMASGAGSWTMASGSLLLATGVLMLAVADLLVSQWALPVSLGWQDANPDNAKNPEVERETPQPGVDLTSVDWAQELNPSGVSTRLGAAMQEIVGNSRGSALAGIVLVSDGRSNQGTPAARAIAAANDANIPVYTIGVGSNQPAQNVRISDLEAPGRVFPDDKFNITAIVQSYGLQGESARVRLTSTNEDRRGDSPVAEDERSIQLPADGEPVTVKFEVSQQAEGRRRYQIEIDPPTGDLDRSDNAQSTVVQVLMRKTKVLLVAGGPTRDYRFLRNQLFRDENVELDVWLQLARPGADQESDNLLFEFPDSAESLDEYDCIVAFDPDWRLLSVEQTRLLERWISEKAGGMLVVAGPVFTPEWTRRPRGEEGIDLIRGLYPVSFYSQGSAALKLGRFGGKQPFPLAFTREGRTARHLWLGGQNSADSIANWESFDGVYGYYAVNEPKAGAEILARFSDESTAIDGELPIYLASHYYGAGRVFFQASGEIWRLRNVNVAYFQTYYLNVIRWISEGRLLRDSTRGVLLLDRNRCWVGDQLVVRAILRDAADQPLMQKVVNATIRRPDGVSESIRLVNAQDAARPGAFSGQFVTSLEGNYEINLPIPFSPDRQSLSGTIRAAIPDLEKVKPERNDALLQETADRTGGLYFFDLSSDGTVKWTEADPESDRRIERQGSLAGLQGISQKIGVVDQESFLPGSPNELFTRKFSRWLFFWLVLVLCTEWVVRRLHKLA